MSPALMINGKMLKLNENYQLDYQGSIEMNIDFVLTDYMDRFPFYYDTTRELVKDLATTIIDTIKLYQKEEEKRKNAEREASPE